MHLFLFLQQRVSNKQPALDRISNLPDEVRVHTLSFLTLEEAARTSVLSKCWAYLWKDVPKLDFSDVWVGWFRNCRLRLSPEREGKYAELVNKVLGSHRAIKLDVFRIQYKLGDDYKEDVDSWLQYALSRSVNRLELNLSVHGMSVGVSPAYTLSPDVLGLSAGDATVVSPTAAFLGFKTLRALTLNAVNVSESTIQQILHSCPLLEDLIVANNKHLRQLQVCGQSLALKHLEIVSCVRLVSLLVFDINIVSLTVTDGDKLVLRNVPNLVDVCIGGCIEGYCGSDVDLFGLTVNKLSCCLSNLVVLTLLFDFIQEERANAQTARRI